MGTAEQMNKEPQNVEVPEQYARTVSFNAEALRTRRLAKGIFNVQNGIFLADKKEDEGW